MLWAAVRRRTILFRATKRGAPYERATSLLAPLADDLDAWRKACGMPSDAAPVIANGHGEPWADYDWDNWRSRTFRAAATAAGLRAGKDDGARRVRPRDLRLELRHAAHLRGPAAAVRRRAARPQPTPRCCATTCASGRTSIPPSGVSAEAQIERVRARLQRAT